MEFATALGITVDLSSGYLQYGQSIELTISGVEHVMGSALNDSITGDGLANILKGGDGDDSLSGGAGADTLDGGAGNDKFSGDSGTDVLNGGAGFDEVSYFASPQGVSVNLNTGAGLGGDAQGDQLVGIEAFFGSRFTNSITANAEKNIINVSGFGADTIVFESTTDSTSAAFDTIFLDGSDKIDLHLIDANGNVADGDQVFSIVASFTGVAGQLVLPDIFFGQNYISADTNGDSVADMKIECFTQLNASNFIL